MNIFEERLRALSLTHAHAREVSVDELADEFRAASGLQVLAVGSGGSLVTARLLTRLIEREQRSIARAVTPLAFAVDPELARGKHLWLFSAEGKNTDILAVLDLAIAAEPARLTVLCNCTDAPLVAKAAAAGAVCLVYPTQGQRDGFLATHTLLLSAALLLRAAACLVNAPDPTLVPLEVDGVDLKQWIESADDHLGPVLGKDTLIVAYDPALAEAAELIETNIWEAAIANVQSVDLRNLAHGRHIWFSRRADSTGLLALTTSFARPIWDGIDAVLPPGLARTSIQIDAPLTALWAAFEITRLAGLQAGVDPANPGVAEFGRSLYNSRGLSSLAQTPDYLAPALRKQSAIRAMGLPPRPLDEVREHERRFRNTLRSERMSGLVLDYDGTMIATNRRGTPPEPDIINRLSYLLGAGLVLGVATGRGGSVGEELRQVLPGEHMGNVLIGYYNGGVCLPLHDKLEKHIIDADDGLIALANKLPDSSTTDWIAEIKRQHIQLSLTPKRGVGLTALRTSVLEALDRLDLIGYTVLNSSHSVDVLAQGVSKLTVLNELRTRLADPTAAFLCIGDSGAWPGNDFDLLSTPHALSVDRVSSRLETGWNLLPAGQTGPRGLAFYLSHAKFLSDRGFIVDLGS